ncbi:MAG: hypothetical protein M5U07_02720 [Xanthobacteraceae bacterium]|nr:hypothetical protein [Xanthobacteraceae bacterium]PWB64393.1 MAG: hypothetical protein C3F17_07165 [Bradyrhizobiaceae bacterium]
MDTFIIGLLSLGGTALLFWHLLPRNGRTHPITNTIWEPLAGVAVTAGTSFGVTLMALGITQLFG